MDSMQMTEQVGGLIIWKEAVLLLSRVEYEVSFSDIDHISPGECPDDTDLGDHRNREAATVTQILSQERCDLVKAPRPGGIRIGAQDKEVFTDCLGLVTFLATEGVISRGATTPV